MVYCVIYKVANYIKLYYVPNIKEINTINLPRFGKMCPSRVTLCRNFLIVFLGDWICCRDKGLQWPLHLRVLKVIKLYSYHGSLFE